jgi:glycosyltransferase involved in cell wall biosynthesis
MNMVVEETKGRLIIVDPSLKDTRGHHYALTRVIVNSAIGSGFQVLVLSNKSTDGALQIAGARVRPVFSKATYDYFTPGNKNRKVSLKQKLHQFVSLRSPESLKVILRRQRERFKKVRIRLGGSTGAKNLVAVGNLHDELLNVLVEEKVSDVGHVLVHTTDGMMYRAILQLLQTKYPLGGYPSFHLCTPYDMRVMPHLANGLPIDRVIGYLDKMDFINRKVFLYAENELLAKSLTSAWGVDVSTLDIPMKKIALQAGAGPAVDGVFRVVYLGAAREEKGFHLIPDVIEAVLNKIGKTQPVEFIIQCSPQIVGYTRKIEEVIERLKSFSGGQVRLIQQQQSEDDYYSVLESADVVLCCYQQQSYQVRGSGIATEAVAYGKTLITTPGTYPEWLAGDAGFSANGSRDIAEAIISIIKNREKCKIKANERAEWFAERTRPDEYVNKLLAREKVARNIPGLVDKRPLAKSTQVSVKEVVTAKSHAGAKDEDATGCENKYNHTLSEAVTSSDGKILFIKQISK